MNEKISKYIDPIKNFWNKLTKNTRRVIVIVFIGIVALAVVLSLLMNQTKFVVLYPGLDHDEAVEVMTELKDMGVGYKEDSGTIYVPSDQENSLRMQLANEGHPKTAPNYDYFTNNINAMTTDYEKRSSKNTSSTKGWRPSLRLWTPSTTRMSPSAFRTTTAMSWTITSRPRPLPSP